MITTYDNLPLVRQEAEEPPIFLKTGSFDLFHEEHIDILKFLKSLGGISVVGVSPDSRVRQRKGPGRPVKNENARVQDVEDSGLVNYVFVMPEGVLGVPKSINRLRPDAFVEHRSDSIGVGITKALLGLIRVKYVVCDDPRICSTTEIIESKTRLAVETSVLTKQGDIIGERVK
jgi:cytidyltransferase-like protein